MPVYELQGKKPNISSDAFVHPDAVIIGDTTLGAGCFIGPGAVIRADFGPIHLGENVSLQDNAVIHVSPGSKTIIGNDCIIGHGALLHDVRLEPECVIGMGAIVLFGVVCGTGSFVAAGSLVPGGMVIPPGASVVGAPAKITSRESSPEQVRQVREGVRLYRELAFQYRNTLRRLS